METETSRFLVKNIISSGLYIAVGAKRTGQAVEMSFVVIMRAYRVYMVKAETEIQDKRKTLYM